MRILVTDGMDKTAMAELKAQGHEVVEQFYEPAELGKALRDFDVVVVRSKTKVRAAQIDEAKGSNLKLIIRGGVGVDNIDVDYAKAAGIDVKNTPRASSESVAELAMAHMFSCARYISHAGYTMRNGQWEKKAYGKGIELCGKTLGVVGFGRIVQKLSQLGAGKHVVFRRHQISVCLGHAAFVGIKGAQYVIHAAKGQAEHRRLRHIRSHHGAIAAGQHGRCGQRHSARAGYLHGTQRNRQRSIDLLPDALGQRRGAVADLQQPVHGGGRQRQQRAGYRRVIGALAHGGAQRADFSRASIQAAIGFRLRALLHDGSQL